MNNEELFKRILNKICIHFGYDVAHDLEYLFLVKEQEIERLNNIIDELEKELDNLIIFNQSNITCNHHTPDDWKDSKLIGNMLYKIKPVSFLAQELKDKLKALKEGKENDR